MSDPYAALNRNVLRCHLNVQLSQHKVGQRSICGLMGSTETVELLPGEGLVERFMSILWSGTTTCLPRPTRCSTPDSLGSEPVRTRRYFLDGARISCGGEYDDDEVDVVRDIMMTVPIFLTLIIFSAFTSQVTILLIYLCSFVHPIG